MRTWLFDLDGVIWLDRQPIPGAADGVTRLQAAGYRVAFLTNNSGVTRADHIAALAQNGITAGPADVLMSADAVATLVAPGERVVFSAGEGARQALEEKGAIIVDEGPGDCVVVGMRRDFDYDRLTVLLRAVQGGARLIGLNGDATYPTADGLIPGGGALLAAVAYAAGVEPVVAGKPNDATVAVVRERLGTVDVVVGDRADTDGLLARRLGARFALVLSGVTTEADLPVEPAPDVTSPDVARLVASELA